MLTGISQLTERDGVVVENDRIVISTDYAKAQRRLHLRALFLMLPIAIGMFPLMDFFANVVLWANRGRNSPGLMVEYTILHMMPWCVAILYSVAYIASVITTRRRKKPIVTLSPAGITVNSVVTQFDLIPWDEIADVRAYTLLYRYVGITLRKGTDFGSNIRSGSGLLLRLNASVIPLYRLLGMFVAPINIAQEYLPITADELVATINDYARNRPAQQSDPMAWPPAPVV